MLFESLFHMFNRRRFFFFFFESNNKLELRANWSRTFLLQKNFDSINTIIYLYSNWKGKYSISLLEWPNRYIKILKCMVEQNSRYTLSGTCAVKLQFSFHFLLKLFFFFLYSVQSKCLSRRTVVQNVEGRNRRRDSEVNKK